MKKNRSFKWLVVCWIVGLSWYIVTFFEWNGTTLETILKIMFTLAAGIVTGAVAIHLERSHDRAYSDGYDAGIAAEKQRQNEYTEQAFERPDEGAMVD